MKKVRFVILVEYERFPAPLTMKLLTMPTIGKRKAN